MYPKLFTIGPFPIYSFGLMMGIGFFVASIVLHKETVRKNIVYDFSPEIVRVLRLLFTVIVTVLIGAFFFEYGISGLIQRLEEQTVKTVITIAAIIGLAYVFKYKLPSLMTADTTAFVIVIGITAGVSGSKLLYLLENLDEVFRRPFDMIFSPGGLTWYGGFALTTILIYIYTKQKGIRFLTICDAAAPALLIGYGIARIGCHLAGDGDYGMPTNLPWAMVYSNGTYPPSVAFREFPEIVAKYGVNGVVPDTIPVHPAPLYEFIAGVILFAVLWSIRKKITTNGRVFMIYLIMSGGARLLVEFVRLNPRLLFGLTEAQLFAILLILIGVIGNFILKNEPPQVEEQIINPA